MYKNTLGAIVDVISAWERQRVWSVGLVDVVTRCGQWVVDISHNEVAIPTHLVCLCFWQRHPYFLFSFL